MNEAKSCQKDGGYHKKECCLGLCDKCCAVKMPLIPSQGEKVAYYQFDVIKELKLCKKTNEMKESKRTERVTYEADIKTLCADLNNEKKKYLYHRYQIENDKKKWKNILQTTDRGDIFWMDYSENITGTPKFEPQDSHFAKKQFSLVCIVH